MSNKLFQIGLSQEDFPSIIIFALWQYLIDVDMDKVEEMFTDTRGILRSLKSEKGRQYSDK